MISKQIINKTYHIKKTNNSTNNIYYHSFPLYFSLAITMFLHLFPHLLVITTDNNHPQAELQFSLFVVHSKITYERIAIKEPIGIFPFVEM